MITGLLVLATFLGGASLAKAQTVCVLGETSNNADNPITNVTVGPGAQPFTPTADCVVTGGTIQAHVTGSPTDDLEVYLYDDNSGDPGSSLEQCSDIDVQGATANYDFTCAGTTTLTSGTQYWLYFSRTGAPSSSNYYRIDGLSGSSLWPEFERFISASWSANGNVAQFSITGATPSETTTVDNEVANLFYGFIMFYLSMFFVVWFFKRT